MSKTHELTLSMDWFVAHPEIFEVLVPGNTLVQNGKQLTITYVELCTHPIVGARLNSPDPLQTPVTCSLTEVVSPDSTKFGRLRIGSAVDSEGVLYWINSLSTCGDDGPHIKLVPFNFPELKCKFAKPEEVKPMPLGPSPLLKQAQAMATAPAGAKPVDMKRMSVYIKAE